jgi:hypothetical protein
MSKDENEHLKWMKDKLTEYEMELTQAQQAVLRLQPVVSHLRGAIDALSRVNRAAEKDDPKLFEIKNSAKPVEQAVEPRSNNGSGHPMPQRRPTYSGMTVIEAIKKVLDDAARPVHAADITKSIFQSLSPQEERRAKHNVVAELYRGMKRKVGWWEALGENTFVSSKYVKPKNDAKVVR